MTRPLSRRRALAALAAGAAATGTLPLWLRRGFGLADAPPRRGALDLHAPTRVAADLPRSLARARRVAKPLLVLVVPDAADYRAIAERGHAFGELLNHGPSATTMLFALCEVACADMAAVRGVAPHVGRGEPLMVLLETDTRAPRFVRLEGALPALYPSAHERPVRDWRAAEQEEDARIDRRIALLGDLLTRGLAADDAMVEARAAQARGALPTAALDALDAALRAGEAPANPLAADRAAAVVLAAARRAAPEPRARMVASLAAAVDARLRTRRVPGSRWARASGCGVQIEGEDDRGGYACGMGHVAARSRRFLSFLTDAT